MFFSASLVILSPKQTENYIMSRKPKAVCVCVCVLWNLVMILLIQGHSSILTFTCLVVFSCTAVNVRVVILLPSESQKLLNTE